MPSCSKSPHDVACSLRFAPWLKTYHGHVHSEPTSTINYFLFIRVHFGFKGFRYSAHTRPIEDPIAMPGKRKAASKAPIRSLSDPRMPKCPPGKGKSQKPQGKGERQEVKGNAFESKSNGSKVEGQSNFVAAEQVKWINSGGPVSADQVRRWAAIERATANHPLVGIAQKSFKSKPNEAVHDVPRFPDGTKIRFGDWDFDQFGCMHIFVKTHCMPVPVTLDVSSCSARIAKSDLPRLGSLEFSVA